jgi:hypothetical protein
LKSLVCAALALVAGTVALARTALADPAPFDLTGPNLRVKVTRGDKTLPISAVPNLMAGDHLWIQAALPATQSARYLLVAAFLRGSTNPPPGDWFFPCETWTRRCQQGMTVTVPQGAQQVLIFLAPKTRGDLHTLVGAVRGRPGAFVRASQDLNQATLDRARLQAYVTALQTLRYDTGDRLKEAAPLLARSLSIKLNQDCLQKISQLQVPCLMNGQDALILNDGHSTSIVEALTSSPSTDLAMEASYTPQLRYGYYSPYIASVLDIARIMGSFDTAQYQYIPALATMYGDQMSLALNSPPSFHNPRSVLVTALPAVEAPQLPPLHAVDPKQMYCARKTSLVLPVEGAPLVFSTGYARDVTLRLTGKNGSLIDLPARPDPEQGGFVVDTADLRSTDLGDSIRGSLHGYWGFDEYQGPAFQLVNAAASSLSLVPTEDTNLIVGRKETVHLQALNVGCIEDVMLRDPSGRQVKAEWKSIKLNELEVKLPLQEAKPGSLTLLITQYGASHPEPLQLKAFSAAGRLDSFTVRPGDTQGLLRGSRLDQVASLSMKGIRFLPGKLTSSQGTDDLTMVAQGTTLPVTLKEGDSASAQVTLKDGRVFDLDALVGAPRPSVTLIGKSVQPSAGSSASSIVLTAPDELPQDAQLTFSVRTQFPAQFARDEQIEVATSDQTFSTTLGMDSGGITLEDSHVAVATLDPKHAFGPSAFGPLQFRVIENGVAGDWQPLVTLVRLPRLKSLTCPATTTLACKLTGSDLFLIDSVAASRQFDHPVQIPDGFPGYSLPVPHPAEGQLYVRLRDDPSVINSAALVAETLPPPPAEPARLAASHASDSSAAESKPAQKPTSTPAPTPTPAPALTPANPAAAAHVAAPLPSPQGAAGAAAAPAAPASARGPTSAPQAPPAAGPASGSAAVSIVPAAATAPAAPASPALGDSLSPSPGDASSFPKKISASTAPVGN